MDHVDLKSYPFPEGVAIPRLMPYQEFPWNGDGYLAAEVLRLKEAHGLKSAVETGTCLASSTLWLAEHFDRVDTTEVNSSFATIARLRVDALAQWKIHFSLGNASAMIDLFGLFVGRGGSFVFLDAHWGANCPLLDELEAIAKTGSQPCIVIHDFQVPGTDFGFDKMPNGRPFNLDLIHTHMNAIYGEGGWVHNYPKQVEGARRGWISIAPASKD